METDGVRVRVRVGLSLLRLYVKKGEIRFDEMKWNRYLQYQEQDGMTIRTR